MGVWVGDCSSALCVVCVGCGLLHNLSGFWPSFVVFLGRHSRTSVAGKWISSLRGIDFGLDTLWLSAIGIPLEGCLLSFCRTSLVGWSLVRRAGLGAVSCLAMAAATDPYEGVVTSIPCAIFSTEIGRCFASEGVGLSPEDVDGFAPR